MANIRHQISFVLRQKAAVFTFYVLLLLVLFNFAGNVFSFQGKDIIEMYHPAKMLLLSFNRVYYNSDFTLLLVQLYPVLVVCPAGFILLSEQKQKEDLLLICKIGSRKYYIYKLVTAFCVTTIVFSVPFLIELLLSYFSFPSTAVGDFTQLHQYDPIYIEMTKRYPMSALFQFNSYLYAIIRIFIFGLFSGVLGMFTVALSAILHIQYKVLLFLPVFILLNASLYISDLFTKLPFSVKWFDYVLLFDDNLKSKYYLIVIIIILTLISVLCVVIKSRGDQL